jgi:uncharacterized damage-inducible protein DinB
VGLGDEGDGFVEARERHLYPVVDDTGLCQLQQILLAPRRDLAWMLLLDAVHHRGQLSTYLRPMGGTVPSIYGPSADTMTVQA